VEEQPWKVARVASPEDPDAGKAKKLSLRERLLLRKAEAAAELPQSPGQPGIDSARGDDAHEQQPNPVADTKSESSDHSRGHKQLGGLDFKWQLMFHPGTRKPAAAVKTVAATRAAEGRQAMLSDAFAAAPEDEEEEQEEGEEDETLGTPKVATPCRRRLKVQTSSPGPVPPPTIGAPLSTPIAQKRPASPSASLAAEAAASDSKLKVSRLLERRISDEQWQLRRPPQAMCGKGLAIPGPGSSLKELRGFLAERGIDTSDCVERSDLEELCGRFDEFCKKDIEELRVWCLSSGAELSSLLGTNIEKLALLAVRLEQKDRRKAFQKRWGASSLPTSSASVASPAPSRARTSCENASPCELQGMPSPAVSSTSPASSKKGAAASTEQPEPASRTEEAAQEIARIGKLRKQTYATTTLWAMTVLGIWREDVAAVQRGHRALMRKLHPDRVGLLEGADKTMELVHEAKACLERAFSQRWPPAAPSKAQASLQCAVAGRRRLELKWAPATNAGAAPVHKYTVAVFDPAYGKALTVAVLEPDYCEELKRFVPVEEICSYVLVEKDFQKMPSLFKQSTIIVQLAAVNDAGQSPWTTLRVRLR